MAKNDELLIDLVIRIDEKLDRLSESLAVIEDRVNRHEELLKSKKLSGKAVIGILVGIVTIISGIVTTIKVFF